MNFLPAALDTDNIANSLSRFVAHVPEDGPNITAVVSEFFAIGSNLRSLDSLYNTPLRPRFAYIDRDVELIVGASLAHTNRVINEVLAPINDHGRIQPSQQNVRQAWFYLRDHFLREAGYPLNIRLQYYKKMLAEMVLIVRSEPANQGELVQLRQILTMLRMAQDQQYAAAQQQRQTNFANNTPPFPNTPPIANNAAPFVNNGQPVAPPAPPPPPAHPGFVPSAAPVAPAPPPPPPQSLALRPRASTPQLKSALRKTPAVPGTPTPKRSYERQRPAGRAGSPHAPGWIGDQSPVSSSVDTPDSPTSMTDSDSTSTDRYSCLDPFDHWAVGLFSRFTTASITLPSSEGSMCHGTHNPDALIWLENSNYDELFRLTFKPNLKVILYLRAADHRARLLCQVHRRNSRIGYVTLPLNKLILSREGSYLLLCKKNKNKPGELVSWLTLEFEKYEIMVLFHCAFIALRGQDSGHPVSEAPDAFALKEVEMYGGCILDDNFLHALRVFWDRQTGAVRLQASVHRGVMTDVPVWTAFIHEQMMSKSWMQQASPKRIILSDLDRATFIDQTEYSPKITRHHEHVLTFKSERGEWV
ncbi:hypothetical protein AJ79_00667 [Helicocarpus griseus UAMH5409]|uniref:Uncharacterized protein n=1 Tax=Helicocarpus griseus UAMH5409 TaxID=1447875 RepID=A0A2B7YAF6_9EURO|nr:hypothetical protein AJ79_00667 [Helicocarpus griseus UAMH5409]